LPLIDILNRKEQIEIAKLEMEKNIDNLRYVEDNIRLEVIQRYSAIQLNSKILFHREEALSICKMQLSYADLEYNNNSIEIADFSRVHDSFVKAIVAYEEARSNYLNSIMILEEITGVNLR
jgi:outer membrane protein TolC